MNIIFIEEMPDSKDQFNVLVHEWKKKRRMAILYILIVMIVAACSLLLVGSMLAGMTP